MSDLTIRPAAPHEIRVALRLALSMPGQRPSETEDQVSSFLRYTEALRLDAMRGWFALANSRIVSTCVCVPSAGRTSMMLLPRDVGAGHENEAIQRLFDEAITAESARRTCLLQCLLDPADEGNRIKLQEMGFIDVAELVYMEKWQLPLSSMVEDCAGRWVTYDSQLHAEFANVITESYVDTQDCQVLRGLREIDDIIAGHKAAGLFSPQRWLMRIDGDEAQGCILLNENPLHPTLEVAYVGVRPAHRRRGVGAALMSRAMTLAASERFERMTLAVDEKNAPAISLYEKLGFQRLTRRRALVFPLSSNPRQP